jgi:GlpG protein
MRLVWTTENADQFRAFCGFLHAKSIAFTTEEKVGADWSSDAYGTRKYLLWITDEDQTEATTNWLVSFIDDPSNPEFTTQKTENSGQKTTASSTAYLEQRLRRPISNKTEEINKPFSGHIRLTAFMILLCSCVFLYELYNEKRLKAMPEEVRQEVLEISPVRKNFLYDYPQSYEYLDKIALLYGVDALAKPQELPESGKFLYGEFLKKPVYHGYFPYIVSFAKQSIGQNPDNLPQVKDLQLFEKIQEGQYYRLFTPALLHSDILHLFFNMMWVLLLGTQIEARLGSFRLLLLMLIAGVLSNTSQYLMTGPNFVGFSGIICAMATYIRARQQIAPWEAYQMSSSTFLFIMFFIGVLALLSMISFFLEVFVNSTLPIAIANTAHLVGAITGYLLGRMRFFSWQLQN